MSASLYQLTFFIWNQRIQFHHIIIIISFFSFMSPWCILQDWLHTSVWRKLLESIIKRISLSWIFSWVWLWINKAPGYLFCGPHWVRKSNHKKDWCYFCYSQPQNIIPCDLVIKKWNKKILTISTTQNGITILSVCSDMYLDPRSLLKSVWPGSSSRSSAYETNK